MTKAKWLGIMQQIEDIIRGADKEVNAQEQTGLRARWESGRNLLRLRQRCGGLRLPNRMLKEFTTALTVHPSELTARMKFAAKFQTEEQLTNVISEFKTWFAIKQKALTDTPREKKLIHPLRRILTLMQKVDATTLDQGAFPLLSCLNEFTERLVDACPTKLTHPLIRIIKLLEKVDAETINRGDLPLLSRMHDLVGRLERLLSEREAA